MHGVKVGRAGVVLLLLRPVARAVPWAPFLTAAGAGLAIVGVPAAMSVVLGPDDLVGLLRVAAVCAALGLAFALDDPAARSLETVPTPRPLRYAVRIAVLAPALAAWWALILTVTVAGAQQDTATALPLRGLTAEAGALALTALAVAAIRIRVRPDGGGLVAGPTVLVLALAATSLPERLVLFVPPDSPQWQTAHGRWASVLVLAFAALAWAARQPARIRRGRGW
jgi:hypothetical protein